MAVVTDTAFVGEHNSYLLSSPMVKTERRALAMAENLLSSLQRYGILEQGDIPRSTEIVLDMSADMPEFKRNLRIIEKSWEGLKS